jgi:formate dehydrogenase
VREILECIFANKPVRKEYTIVKNGDLAGTGKHSYTKGNATGGSKEAAKYKRR